MWWRCPSAASLASSTSQVGQVLAEQYIKLVEAGWPLTEADIARDVDLLFGGAFEAFLNK